MITRMRGVMATGALQGETLVETARRMSAVLDLKASWAERIVITDVRAHPI